MTKKPGSPGPYPRLTTEKVREVLLEAEDPVLDVGELADAVGVSRQALNDRLDEFLDDEIVRHKKVGKTHVFWHKNVEGQHAWARSTTEREEEPAVDPTIGDVVVDGIDVGGPPEIQKMRRAAVNVVFKYLYLNKDESSNNLFYLVCDYPFTESYESKVSLWNNCIWNALSGSDHFQFNKGDESWYLTEAGKEERDKRTVRETR